MDYYPLNYENINQVAGTYNPSPVKAYNNLSFMFWQRALFQRASSVLEFTVPDAWKGQPYDFLMYCLMKFGFVAVFNHPEFGFTFQPGTLQGLNWYYQPVEVQISNPAYNDRLMIGKDCEILSISPDKFGYFDIISFYAEKLSNLDNAINMSLINNKFAFILGARNKSAGEALKKILDKVNKGEPAVIYDMNLLNDKTDKDSPFQFLERRSLKDSYLTTMQLADLEQIIKEFDQEIGIPTISEKKERLVTSEAETKIIDSTSRSVVWYNTAKQSIDIINTQFGVNLAVKLRYQAEESEVPDEQF